MIRSGDHINCSLQRKHALQLCHYARDSSHDNTRDSRMITPVLTDLDLQHSSSDVSLT